MPELIPLYRGEFTRWVLLCKGAGRFCWREVGRLRGYCADAAGVAFGDRGDGRG